MPQYAKQQPAGYKNYLEKIAIVGAGGQMGEFIVEALLQIPRFRVTAITRPDSTNKIPHGIDVKKADYNDKESLVAALRGHDALIITMNVQAQPDAQSKLIEAAAEADIPWIMPNEYGVDTEHEDMSRDNGFGPRFRGIREKIEGLGKSSWVALICGFWYEFSLSGFELRYGFDFPNRAVTLFDDGDVKINTSTWPQTALAVARLFSLKVLPEDENDKSPCLDNFRNKSCYISSFLVSQKDMFASVLRVTGTTEKDWTIRHEPSTERFKAGGEAFKAGDMMGWAKLLYTRTFYPDNAGNFEDSKGLSNDVLGLPKEDLDQWTKVAIDMVENGYHTKR